VDNALKTRGFIYENVETWLLFAHNNQVSTFSYIKPLVFKALSTKCNKIIGYAPA